MPCYSSYPCPNHNHILNGIMSTQFLKPPAASSSFSSFYSCWLPHPPFLPAAAALSILRGLNILREFLSRPKTVLKKYWTSCANCMRWMFKSALINCMAPIISMVVTVTSLYRCQVSLSSASRLVIFFLIFPSEQLQFEVEIDLHYK